MNTDKVVALIEKAAKAASAVDALQFSQAALNTANALYTSQQVKERAGSYTMPL